jgi:hypothetical protein
MNFSFILSIIIAVITLISLASSSTVSANRYEARLVGGKRWLDIDGAFLRYYIFAEERAVITPTPEYVIWDLQTGAVKNLAPVPPANAGNARNSPTPKNNSNNMTVTHSMSQSMSFDENEPRSRMRWYIKSQPFGALGVQGPRSWLSSGHPLHRFRLTDWVFPTAGEYNIGFNVTFYNGGSFKFNQTIHVIRQPALLANGPLPFGYNGSAWSPAPIGYVQNILGITIATSSVNVTLEIQAYPDGATWSGTLTKFTSTDGSVRFDNLIVSIPGAYTYRMVALLSDGTVLGAQSVQINVERALPIVIQRLTSMDGIARFYPFQVPVFVIYDSVGLDYDPRLNLSLRLASNAPLYSYEGYESTASISGVTSVQQNITGYTFSFPGISIDLPGPYEVAADIALPDFTTLTLRFIANIEDAPTFEFPAGRNSLQTNKISTMTIHGVRPDYDEILLMLAVNENCSDQASDMIVWPRESANVSAAKMRNFSVVPWIAGTLYPCMKIPSQPFFGHLVQNYLPQFDEKYPLITSISVSGVSECPVMSSLEALQYQSQGWDSAEANRRYGCALPNPSSGTISPCSCPSHLTCSELTHPVFTPANLNIGTCQCCAGWIMAVASLVIASVFAILLYVVYEYV